MYLLWLPDYLFRLFLSIASIVPNLKTRQAWEVLGEVLACIALGAVGYIVAKAMLNQFHINFVAGILLYGFGSIINEANRYDDLTLAVIGLPRFINGILVGTLIAVFVTR